MLLKDLTTLTASLASGTLFHVEKSGKAYNIDYTKLAKAIVEEYNGSTLGGSAQTVQAAIGALNSRTGIDLNLSTVGSTNFTIQTNRSGKKNGIYVVDITLQANQDISSTSEINLGTVSIAPLASIGTGLVRSNDTRIVGALLISNNGSVYLRLTEPINKDQSLCVSMCGY
jgi:hypothetical protein